VKVLSNGVTAEETSILHENVESGTATRSAIDCPTAAKTGTTSELIDAWLDGYTPRYSTVVWMGYPNKRVPMTDVHGEPQQGGYLPAEIWHDYMASVMEGKPCLQFPTPTEPLSYQPFFGKYASTGRSLQQSELSETLVGNSQPTPSRHGRTHGGRKARETLETPEVVAPSPGDGERGRSQPPEPVSEPGSGQSGGGSVPVKGAGGIAPNG
jgi:penicillin-binding protein 1A